MQTRALVLGGGGITGVAWEFGIIAGLAEAGIDLAAADVIIGTSAGSVVGANIALGEDPQALYARQLEAPAGEIAAKIGIPWITRFAWIGITTRDPQQARRKMGHVALAADTVPEADRRKVIESRLARHEWPDRALKLTAIDAGSGEFVVFDSAGEASLVDAVGASCAVPGIWPPVTIGNRRFFDGGLRTVANADLAAGYDRVLIVAPIAGGGGPFADVERDAAALRNVGAQVVVVEPDSAAKTAIGRNVLDPARRAPAARAGKIQAASVADQVRALWQSV